MLDGLYWSVIAVVVHCLFLFFRVESYVFSVLEIKGVFSFRVIETVQE